MILRKRTDNTFIKSSGRWIANLLILTRSIKVCSFNCIPFGMEKQVASCELRVAGCELRDLSLWLLGYQSASAPSSKKLFWLLLNRENFAGALRSIVIYPSKSTTRKNVHMYEMLKYIIFSSWKRQEKAFFIVLNCRKNITDSVKVYMNFSEFDSSALLAML